MSAERKSVVAKNPRQKKNVSARNVEERRTKGVADLTERQKKIFDQYIKFRSIEKTASSLNMNMGDVYRVYQSQVFQAALKEWNAAILDTVDYNTAVIIDNLWKMYHADDIGYKEKVNIIVKLGQHIGMWSTRATSNEEGPQNVQYNIINYNGPVEREVMKMEKEILPALEQTIEGIEITSYA